MWGDNSTTNYAHGYNTICMCNTATIPCACTNPMTTNEQINSNNMYCQISAHENTIYDKEAVDHSYQMSTNEVDSWLLSNPDNGQVNDNDGSLNLPSYGFNNGNQYLGQFIDQMQTDQGFQASLLPMVGGIAPEATFGTMDLPQEYWGPNQFSFSTTLYPGNLITDTVGTYSNSTSINSLGTQQLVSQNDSQKKPEYPPILTRQDRLLRYFAKKKARKYEKRTIISSRKTYAQTRPRIRGRFVRVSQTDANDETAVEVNDKKVDA